MTQDPTKPASAKPPAKRTGAPADTSRSGRPPPAKGKPGRPTHRAAPGHGAGSRDDEDSGPVWLYGIHAVTAALANPARRFHRLIATRNAARHLEAPPIEPQILDPDGMSGMLPPGAVHQGLGLLVDPLAEPAFPACVLPARAEAPVVLLDRVTDPQNVGAVLRSSAVFGARAVVTTARRSPPITGTLAKAATGAVEHVPYAKVANLARAIESLRGQGYTVLGLAEEGAEALHTVAPAGPVALILGAEGDGLRESTRELCDHLVHIPTPGPIGALNVSNAAAIALYHLAIRSVS